MELFDDSPTNTLKPRQNSSGLNLFSVISQENNFKSQNLNPDTDTLFVWAYVNVCRLDFVCISLTEKKEALTKPFFSSFSLISLQGWILHLHLAP